MVDEILICVLSFVTLPLKSKATLVQPKWQCMKQNELDCTSLQQWRWIDSEKQKSGKKAEINS